MHLLIPSYAGDPTSAAPVANVHCGVTQFVHDSIRQSVQFTVGYYRTLADYDANVAPISTASYTFTPNPETRADGASIPSYFQVLGLAATTGDDPAGTLAVGLIQRAIITFLATLPEFAGASLVS